MAASEEAGDVTMADASETKPTVDASSDVDKDAFVDACSDMETEDAKKEATDDKAEEKKEEESPSPEEKVVQAESLKEAGNAALKAGDFKQALEQYMEGVRIAEPALEKALDKDAKDAEKMDEELQKRCKAICVALRSNSAQACLNLQDWAAASEHADKVLEKDGSNAKALYRRAVASLRFETKGRLEMAVEDLVRVCELDKANRKAREELRDAKEKLRALREEEKKRISGALAGGLYKDNHAKTDRLRLQYEEEVTRRKEAKEDEITFDDWHKKLKEDEEKRQKTQKEEREKRQETAEWEDNNAKRKADGLEEQSLEEWRKVKKAPSRPTGLVVKAEDAQMDLDEEDKKLLAEASKKGYYHGRLGTVLSDEAPKPQKLDREASPEAATEGRKSMGSQWNTGGTWEELDCSAWCKDHLTECLKEAAVARESVTLATGKVLDAAAGLGKAATMTARVRAVKSITGDAQIVTVRQKRRCGYNYVVELSVRVEITEDQEGAKTQSVDGYLKLPEVMDCVTDLSELRIEGSWKGSPSEELKAVAIEGFNKMKEQVRCQIGKFVEAYKNKA